MIAIGIKAADASGDDEDETAIWQATTQDARVCTCTSATFYARRQRKQPFERIVNSFKLGGPPAVTEKKTNANRMNFFKPVITGM